MKVKKYLASKVVRVVSILAIVLVVSPIFISQVFAVNEPSAITTLVGYGENTQAVLTWTAPADNGSAITDYVVEYKLASDGSWTTFVDGTSTTALATVTSLTNAASYNFRVSGVNGNGTGAVSNTATTTPMGVLFQDNFDALTNGAISGQNGWTNGGSGTWIVGSGGGGKVVTSGGTSSYTSQYISQGNQSWTNQRVKADYQAGTTDPTIWLRKSDKTGATDGYLMFEISNTWYLKKYYATPNTTGLIDLAQIATPITLTTSSWFTIEFEVLDNTAGQPVLRAWVYAQGGTRPAAPTLTYTDEGESNKEGYAAIGASGNTVVPFDNVQINGTANENVTLIQPAHRVSAASSTATIPVIYANGKVAYVPYIQTSTTLSVRASVGSSILPSGGGVKFTLNPGESSQQTSFDLSEPFIASFTGLAKGTYIVKAELVNSSQVVQSGAGYSDQVSQVGIGDIYLVSGDSIAQGFYSTSYGATHIKSWLEAAAGAVSSDNRNYPQGVTTYQNGFLKDLNDILSTYYGYPIFIRNEGVSGTTSSTYNSASNFKSDSSKNRIIRLVPNKFLFSIGTNDATGAVSSPTFQTNMDAIIDYANSFYGIGYANMYFAKPFYRRDAPTSTLATYLPIYDNLLTINSATSQPGPNFYNYFSNYTSTYFYDDLHPNNLGQIRMARLWGITLMAPKTFTVTQSGSTAVLTWENLATYESLINGYKVKYGTTSGASSGTYTTTTDVSNVLTTTISGLTSGQTYYFTVTGYYDDAVTVTESSRATEVSLSYNTDAPSISNIAVTPTSTTAPITWTTDEAASSQIEYGLSSSYGTTTSETDTSPRVTSHSVTLPSLAACTTYNYRVVSKDAVNNESLSSDGTFTTSGCTGGATILSQAVQAITTVSGGSLSLVDGSSLGLNVTVPPAFAGSNATFQAHQLDKTTVLATTSSPTGYTAAGQYFYQLSALSNINTLITSFSTPLTVQIAYSTNDITGLDESSLKIYRWDGSSWSQLSGCAVDASANTVTCTTSNFSVFGLFGQTSSSASSSPSTTSTSGSSSSSNGSSSSSTECALTPPGLKRPWLYAAVAKDGNSVLLYFTESDNPVDHYTLQFGTNSGEYPLGALNIGDKGSRTYLVQLLFPNTKYYFRIRGANGCAAGEWSNEISATTKRLISFKQLTTTSLEVSSVVPNSKNEAISQLDQAEIEDSFNPGPTPPLVTDLSDSNSTPSPSQNPEEYSVKIQIRDTHQKPVSGAKVIIHSKVQETVSDVNGIAQFKNVEPGDHKIFVAYNGFNGQQSVNLTGGTTEEFTVNITLKQEYVLTSPLVLGIIAISSLIIISLIILLIRTKRRQIKPLF